MPKACRIWKLAKGFLVSLFIKYAIMVPTKVRYAIIAANFPSSAEFATSLYFLDSFCKGTFLCGFKGFIPSELMKGYAGKYFPFEKIPNTFPFNSSPTKRLFFEVLWMSEDLKVYSESGSKKVKFA